MLRTALTLSAAAMLMLSASQITQAQDYGESQPESQAQVAQPDASTPTSEPDGVAIIEQEEQGVIEVIEPKPGEAAVEDQHGLDAADELARSMPLDNAEEPDASLAMTDDLDADDPDRLAQAPLGPDPMQSEIQDEDQRTDAAPNNGPDLEAEQNAHEGRDLDPLPAPDNQQ